MIPKDFDLGPPAAVQHTTDGGRSTLVFVRVMRHSPEKVWTALTRPESLTQWAPFTPSRALDSVGAVTLKMIDGHAVEEFQGEVTRVSPPSLLEYTWGDDVLRWELERKGRDTRLTLRHTVTDASWMPPVAAGWHICLAVAERLLAGRPVGPIVGREAKKHGWEKLRDDYAKTLGVEGKDWPEEIPAD